MRRASTLSRVGTGSLAAGEGERSLGAREGFADLGEKRGQTNEKTTFLTLLPLVLMLCVPACVVFARHPQTQLSSSAKEDVRAREVEEIVVLASRFREVAKKEVSKRLEQLPGATSQNLGVARPPNVEVEFARVFEIFEEIFRCW